MLEQNRGLWACVRVWVREEEMEKPHSVCGSEKKKKKLGTHGVRESVFRNPLYWAIFGPVHLSNCEFITFNKINDQPQHFSFKATFSHFYYQLNNFLITLTPHEWSKVNLVHSQFEERLKWKDTGNHLLRVKNCHSQQMSSVICFNCRLLNWWKFYRADT